MTDGQFDEVHEISKRLDRIIATGKWVIGLSVPIIGAVFIYLLTFATDVSNRVTSLETSRDSTADTIKRIDLNVQELTRYMRDFGRDRP